VVLVLIAVVVHCSGRSPPEPTPHAKATLVGVRPIFDDLH
jgi:hypothetical protein